MVQYTSKDDTPLLFHHFFRFIALPVNTFSLISAMMFDSLGMSYFTEYRLAFFIFMAVSIALNTLIFICFFRWKPYTFYLITARSAIGIASSLFVIIRHVSHHNAESFVIIAERAGMIFAFCCITYYYLKRKPLFLKKQ